MMKRLLIVFLSFCALPVMAGGWDRCLDYDVDEQKILIGPFLDETDGVSAETALTIEDSDVQIWERADAAFGDKADISDCTHKANGWYECTLDQTDVDSYGMMKVVVVCQADSCDAGEDALPVWHDYLVATPAYCDWLANADSMQANIVEISADATAADNAELFFDGTGYAGTGNVIPTVTTLTGHTAQTGNNYPRLGAPNLASVSADIEAIDNYVDDLETRISQTITFTSIGGTQSPDVNVIGWEDEVVPEATDTGIPKVDVDWFNAVDVTSNIMTAADVEAEALDAIQDAELDHLIDQAVVAAQIADNSIIAMLVDDAATADWDNYDNTTASLEALNVDTDAIVADTGTDGVVLANDAITAAKIAADAIGASEIATAAIAADEIATDAIGAAEIASAAIAADEIAANAIGASEIATDAIGAAEIAADAITSAEVATSALGTTELDYCGTGIKFIVQNNAANSTSQVCTDLTDADFGDDQFGGSSIPKRAVVFLTGNAEGLASTIQSFDTTGGACSDLLTFTDIGTEPAQDVIGCIH